MARYVIARSQPLDKASVREPLRNALNVMSTTLGFMTSEKGDEPSPPERRQRIPTSKLRNDDRWLHQLRHIPGVDVQSGNSGPTLIVADKRAISRVRAAFGANFLIEERRNRRLEM